MHKKEKQQMQTKRAVTALMITAAAVLAGCGTDSSGGDGESKGSEAETVSDGSTVTVKMTDNAFDPKLIRVKEGDTVTFRFVNDGNVTHEALIGEEEDQTSHAAEMAGMDGSSDKMGDGAEGDHMEGHGGAAEVVTVEPGKSGELTRTFDEPGKLIIGCHQPGHYDSGMVAEIEVG